jgi:cell division protein YceG involved in septum cleavage
MQETKRKISRQNKKKKKLFLLYVLIFILFSGALSFLYFNFFRTQSFISPLAPDFKIDSAPERQKKLQIVKKLLDEKKIEYKEIIVYDKYFALQMSDKSQVLISSEKDISTQLASLQFILSRLTMEGKAIDLLDLRFDKPVIRLK